MIDASEENQHRIPRWVVRLLAIVAAAAVLGLTAHALYVWTRVRHRLEQTEIVLRTADRALKGFDFEASATALNTALLNVQKAEEAISRPSVQLGSFLPWVGEEIKSARNLIHTYVLLARAGVEGSEALAALATPSGASAIYDNNRVDLEILEKGGNHLHTASELIDQATAGLASVEIQWSDTLQSARDELEEQLADVRPALHDLRSAFLLLPKILGQDSDRRYLLAFQSLGEARATGGIFGFVGILGAKDGHISLRDVGSFTDLPTRALPEIEAPVWFRRSYGPQGALVQWTQTNVSPNFPVVADVALQMFEARTGTRLDGVVALDAIALRNLLTAIGPIEVEAESQLSSRLTSTNVVRTVLRDSYLVPTQTEQNEYLVSLIESFWSAFGTRSLEFKALLSQLALSIETRHLQIYFDDSREQKISESADATGTYRSDTPNVQMFFDNNYGSNKVGYFLSKELSTDAYVEEDGSMTVRAELLLHNDAPRTPASFLLGFGDEGLAPGANRMTVNLLLPIGSKPKVVEVNRDRAATLLYEDGGHPVVWAPLTIAPGDTGSLHVEYSIPKVVVGDKPVEFVLFPQPSVKPASYRLTIQGATGIRVSASSMKGELSEDGVFRDQGLLFRPERFIVRSRVEPPS